MQEQALYGARMMQPGLTAADSEENSLRPQHLEDYIGQEKVKQNLKIYLEAARRFRQDPQAVAVFEDAIYAVKTAKTAGFYTVGVFEETHRREWPALSALADEIVEDWRNVL